MCFKFPNRCFFSQLEIFHTFHFEGTSVSWNFQNSLDKRMAVRTRLKHVVSVLKHLATPCHKLTCLAVMALSGSKWWKKIRATQNIMQFKSTTYAFETKICRELLSLHHDQYWIVVSPSDIATFDVSPYRQLTRRIQTAEHDSPRWWMAPRVSRARRVRKRLADKRRSPDMFRLLYTSPTERL